jgi:hypothetical protein
VTAKLWSAALLLGASCVGAEPGFTWTNSDGQLSLTENGKPVLVYQMGMKLANGAPEMKRRAGYIHPLYAPNGAIVTDDFPKDHWHHRGVFWAWQAVRYQGVTHDQWTLTGGIYTRPEKSSSSSGKSAALNVTAGWFFDGQRIIDEYLSMRADPLEGNSRKLHFTIRLEATGDPVELTGELANNKGYGGFSVRFAPREDTVVRTDKGMEVKDTDMAPHPWAELEATYYGKRAALRIDDDGSNAGYPNGWCLRNYGFLGVNYPGLAPLTIEKGKPVILKYTLTVRAIE